MASSLPGEDPKHLGVQFVQQWDIQNLLSLIMFQQEIKNAGCSTTEVCHSAIYPLALNLNSHDLACWYISAFSCISVLNSIGLQVLLLSHHILMCKNIVQCAFYVQLCKKKKAHALLFFVLQEITKSFILQLKLRTLRSTLYQVVIDQLFLHPTLLICMMFM